MLRLHNYKPPRRIEAYGYKKFTVTFHIVILSYISDYT